MRLIRLTPVDFPGSETLRERSTLAPDPTIEVIEGWERFKRYTRKAYVDETRTFCRVFFCNGIRVIYWEYRIRSFRVTPWWRNVVTWRPAVPRARTSAREPSIAINPHHGRVSSRAPHPTVTDPNIPPNQPERNPATPTQ